MQRPFSGGDPLGGLLNLIAAGFASMIWLALGVGIARRVRTARRMGRRRGLLPRSMPCAVFLLCALAVPGREAWAQKGTLPIIDMHMHARTAHHYGPNPGPVCAPVDRMPSSTTTRRGS